MIMVYCITYDLKGDEKNYDALIQAIKDIGDYAWFHFAQSAWIIKSSLKTASEVYNSIKQYLDHDDICLVIEVTHDYDGNLESEDIKRLESFIFS